ncbi:hypothetical protein AURDEDRAFT_176514 [Auricularia subglabra TFB-10046 SS5]|uniref:Gfd2/YDR514C-like C-terminal domain-containing protein n=1 Tax=Auricularia subglabra (strain TFB-10046 / SS5) TaxID=717982 RepID=J0CVJ4_AURST|nr:hypothetical protein AURDEDRAFT_176514 [Auricularia subglabra TFB-10046 SS5]
MAVPAHKDSLYLISDVVHGIEWTSHPVSSPLRRLVRQLSPKGSDSDSPPALSVHPLMFAGNGDVVYYEAVRRDDRRRSYLTAEQFDRIVAVAVHLLENDPGYAASNAQGKRWDFPVFGKRVRAFCVGGGHDKDLAHAPELAIYKSDVELAEAMKRNKSAARVLSPRFAPSQTPAPLLHRVTPKRDVMAEARAAYDLARACYDDDEGTWMAIDAELTRGKPKGITEIGWTTSRASGPQQEPVHFVIEDVTPHSSHPVTFMFGQSRVVSLSYALDEVRAVVAEALRRGPLFVLCHDDRLEAEYLRDLHNVLPASRGAREDGLEPGSVLWFDTQYLFAGLTGTRSPENMRIGLPDLLTTLKVPFCAEGWHNAGNDAKARALVHTRPPSLADAVRRYEVDP